MSRPLLRRTAVRIARSTKGASLTEFALIAPVLMTMLIGFFDIGHTAYMQATLQGAVQKAARDSSLQNSTPATLDAKITEQVRQLNNTITAPTITRRFFRNYTDAAVKQHEPFADTNSNGRCDNGESYTDKNWNNAWDRDGGDAGQGGAQDRVVYTVSVSYPRMFPLHRFVTGVPANVQLTASTVLANQPYNEQGKYADNPPSRVCA